MVKRSVRRRRDLDRGLVGLEHSHRLVGGDGRAVGLEPLDQHRLGHRFREARNHDVAHCAAPRARAPAGASRWTGRGAGGTAAAAGARKARSSSACSWSTCNW